MMKNLFPFILCLLFISPLVGCGGGGTSGSSGGGTSAGDDFVVVSTNGAGSTTHTEAFSAAIVCDPRVDWAFNQVILYSNHLGGSNWELLLDIMFIDDSVGTYDVTVPSDGIQVAYMQNGTQYLANFAQGSGTITVTRSDTRIEGTFNVTVDDGTGNTMTLSGSFGVDAGNSLSCP